MSSKDELKGKLPNNNKLLTKLTKSNDLERIRQSLARRSLDVKFELEGSNYKPIENIGIGAYGVVCSAIHSKSGEKVAIKKIPNVFDALTVAKRTYREIKILKHFKHDNIICIREILMPKENVKTYQEIYVVFDLMESDLHRIIYSDQELSEEHVRYFLYQILRGLKYIHSANVVHRDLKPSNLLVNQDCHLRIGDFGMARGMFYTPNEPSYYMTQYVATRWYRAPEILLSMLEYGTAVDMWSVGCIFAEMMGRKHIFPGKDYMSQVKLILGVLGTPSESVMKHCQNDILKRIIKSFGKKEQIAWDKLFPKASKKSIDLLSKMLVLNPADRIPVERALSHRLLNNYHDPDDEPICLPSFNFDFEKEEIDKVMLRDKIMHEIQEFHQPRQSALSFNAFLRPAPKLDKISDKHDGSSPSESNKTKSDDKESSLTKNESHSSLGQKIVSKSSPVSVDMAKLQVLDPSTDVEMLSAQSNDGRVMETHGQDIPQKSLEIKSDEINEMNKTVETERDGQVKPTAPDKKKNIISEDTKALVKQALLNATQRRQRAESHSDEVDKSKPVTAQQRQKEREEKRKKKKERALEKTKKAKQKIKGASEQNVSLSNQDMELLRRWTVMQNPQQNHQPKSNSPPSTESLKPPENGVSYINSTVPGVVQGNKVCVPLDSSTSGNLMTKPRQILAKATSTVTLSSSLNLQSSQVTTGGTVIIPSSHIGLPQSNFIPVIAIPSAVDPGKLEIKRIFQSERIMSQAENTSNNLSSNVSEGTKAMLQNAILLRNQTESTMSVPEPKPNNPIPTTNAFNTSSLNVNTFSSDVSFPNVIQSEDIRPKHEKENNMFGEEKLPTQENDLSDFLDKHIKDEEKKLNNLDNLFFHSNSNSSVNQSSQLSLHQPHCQSYNTSDSLPQIPVASQNQLNPNKDYSLDNCSIPFSGYNEQILPNSFHGQSEFKNEYECTTESNSFNNSQNFLAGENFGEFTSNSADLNFVNNASHHTNNWLSGVGNYTPQPSSQQQAHTFNSTGFQTQPDFGNSDSSFQSPSSSMLGQYNQDFNNFYTSPPQQPVPSAPDNTLPASLGNPVQSQGFHHRQSEQSAGPSFSGFDNPGRPNPGLAVNCSKPNVSDSPSDLIALLSKQLSKSQVADIFPPTLTLTPKGTGAGYGVGMDLDSMFTDAQDVNTSTRLDQSPLSSSLLADWLDVSSSISQADIEALERELQLQSPMNISFNL